MKHCVKYSADDASIFVEYNSEALPDFIQVNGMAIPKSKLDELIGFLRMLRKQIHNFEDEEIGNVD